MSSDGLIIRIAEEARIPNDEAFGALIAAFQGLLSISTPSTFEGRHVEAIIIVNPPPHPIIDPPPHANIVVNPPPHPSTAKPSKSRQVRSYGELLRFIAESVDISIEAAGATLGVITQAIVEGGKEAGLRAYYEFEPPTGARR